MWTGCFRTSLGGISLQGEIWLQCRWRSEVLNNLNAYWTNVLPSLGGWNYVVDTHVEAILSNYDWALIFINLISGNRRGKITHWVHIKSSSRLYVQSVSIEIYYIYMINSWGQGYHWGFDRKVLYVWECIFRHQYCSLEILYQKLSEFYWCLQEVAHAFPSIKWPENNI